MAAAERGQCASAQRSRRGPGFALTSGIAPSGNLDELLDVLDLLRLHTIHSISPGPRMARNGLLGASSLCGRNGPSTTNRVGVPSVSSAGRGNSKHTRTARSLLLLRPGAALLAYSRELVFHPSFQVTPFEMGRSERFRWRPQKEECS